MSDRANEIDAIQRELEEGMALEKCRVCGCMQSTLEALRGSSGSTENPQYGNLTARVEDWLGQMEPLEYDCLGCDPCYPAEAMKIFERAGCGKTAG